MAQSQVNLNLGLMAYYPFNGNGADASGNNNHPVFNNATSVADRFGNPNSAYFFNGTNNYMRILNSATLNTSNQMSLCAWVKVTGFYQGTCHDNAIIMKGDVDNVPGNYLLRFGDVIYTNFQNCAIPVPDENHETFYGHQSTNPVPNTNPYVEKERWYSLVWTSDGVTSKTYVNCQLTLTGPSGNLTFTNGYDLYLGRMNHPSYPYWFNGTMDEIRIYNRVLNSDEINAYGACAGIPDLTSSQFFTSTQLIPGGSVSEVMVVRNVGTGATTAPFSFNITNYTALTGLTITPVTANTNVTIGFTTYTISAGWTFTPATGTFTCSNVIPAGGASNLGILISRGTGGSAGANGIVTQTSTIPPGTGGNETPTNNNSISNFLLKNNQ
jgi:hypothetical protein